MIRTVAIIVGGSLTLLFFFVPETFWDRTPTRKPKSKRPGFYRSVSELAHGGFRGRHPERAHSGKDAAEPQGPVSVRSPTSEKPRRDVHVGFEDDLPKEHTEKTAEFPFGAAASAPDTDLPFGATNAVAADAAQSPTTEPASVVTSNNNPDQVAHDEEPIGSNHPALDTPDLEAARTTSLSRVRMESEENVVMNAPALYTHNLREQPRITYWQTLRLWNGRLSHDKWWRAAVRPFVLFVYPSVLWSALVYSLSIGWLIVVSESIALLYENKETYNFSPLGTGLVYISPFVGGILGTAVAGRVSDMIVRWMTRRNGGIYEPEFRLVMAIPVAISTAIGLMGFGWSVQERDAWIVPTIFFGIISFGCSLGSTTSITFCVDSYRQYAGEALVTLNFSKSRFPYCWRYLSGC